MPSNSSLRDFEVLYTIGSGSYGTCKKVKRKRDGKVFVWKEMDYGSMTEAEKQMLVSEVNLLRELKHENIVRYHERVIDKQKQVLYLIMEFCEGGDLAALIKRYQRDGRHFDEEMIWKALTQCASALNECHKRKDGKSILHRDLKPANIFLDSQKNVKLGDFGLARVLHHETSFAKTFVGTPYYMSPEQMNKQSYNEKSDIWSMGCVLYEMCTLHPPFLASNQRELATKIKIGHFNRIPVKYSTELSQLISKMLSVECGARPSIEELLSMKRVTKYLPSTLSSSVKCNSTSATELTKKYLERENKLVLKESRLEEMEKRLNEREADLNYRENKLKQKEKELERKLSSLADSVKKPITPILCRVKKSPDSPSKHVSFETDKENEIASTAVNVAALIRKEKINTDNQLELDRRRELKERLERAKQRAAELKNAEIESKLRFHKILNIR